jgi:SAM-dependent methyltransferase
MICRACDNTQRFRIFSAKEMMFGWRHSFDYAECLDCGTIEIVKIPANLGDYYPKDYYSLSADGGSGGRPSLARKIATRFLLKAPGTGWITRKLSLRYPFLDWARLSGNGPDSAYLDVGCGGGRLLRRMQRCGFTNLRGVDPYAPQAVTERGFKIDQAELESVQGKFDLIILSHVLEHLADPVATLVTARGLLNPKGTILARVPVAGSKVAQDYGPHWFNLDPPRHLVVPSLKGMQLIAKKAGLTVSHIEFDAIEESALVSESYSKDVPMREMPKPPKAERNRLRRAAQELNRQGRGDLAAFFLTVAPKA